MFRPSLMATHFSKYGFTPTKTLQVPCPNEVTWLKRLVVLFIFLSSDYQTGSVGGTRIGTNTRDVEHMNHDGETSNENARLRDDGGRITSIKKRLRSNKDIGKVTKNFTENDFGIGNRSAEGDEYFTNETDDYIDYSQYYFREDISDKEINELASQHNTTSKNQNTSKEPHKDLTPLRPTIIMWPLISRIVGGRPSRKGEYDFLASLLTPSRWGYHSHSCGGTLIAPNVILCAAHCAAGGAVKYARLGLHNTNQYAGTEVHRVVEYRLCPRWNRRTFHCDVALLRLARPSGREVVQLSLAEDELQTGRRMTVVGWGTTSFGGWTPPQLMEADVYPMDDYECKKRLGVYITDMMVCAKPNGADACQGDSGGPLLIKGTPTTPTRQTAVVSWGMSCAHTYYPGVYARLHKDDVVNFINQQTCQWSPSSCSANKFRNIYRKDDAAIEVATNVMETVRKKTNSYINLVWKFGD